MANKIRHLEEQFEDSDSKESLCKEIKELPENGNSDSPQYKCSKFGFKFDRDITLRKHENTIHSEKKCNQ